MPNAATLAEVEALGRLQERYRYKPVDFVREVIGVQPDPWQADVLDWLADPNDRFGLVRACHGVGKTSVESWAIIWFLVTRTESVVFTTSSTFTRGVRDVLWGSGVSKWWRRALTRLPLLDTFFECQTTRLHARAMSGSWYAVGAPSKDAGHLEGFHADQYILILFDEAKEIPKQSWEAVHGMMTAPESKMLVASTPSGPGTEFHKQCTELIGSWRSFVIHPLCLKAELGRPEAVGYKPNGAIVDGGYARGGTYYSPRLPSWLEQRFRANHGPTSPQYVARIIGDFPLLENNRLIRYDLILAAKVRTQGSDGPVVVGCDVADGGADRTVAFVLKGGTIIDGDAIGPVQSETTVSVESLGGIMTDPKRPSGLDSIVTANLCLRLARKHGATAIAIDAGGVGSGATAILRRSGFQIIPVNFGASPPGRPEDPEDRKWKAKREGEFPYANMKAEIAWYLREAFEDGSISLAWLDDPLREDALLRPLLGQLACVRHEMNTKGLTVIIDPDMSLSEDMYFDDQEEIKRSPDHFHALMIAWYAARHFKRGRPEGGRALKHSVSRIGHLPARRPGDVTPSGSVPGGTVRPQLTRGGVAGQAAYLDKL